MRLCIAAALLAALAFGASPAAFAGSWGAALGASTDNVVRGLTLSDGKPSLQADAHYSADARWFAGLGAATLDLASDDGGAAQIDAYLGYAWPVSGSLSARLLLAHYDYPWDEPHSVYNYDELGTTLAWADRVFLTIAWSPDRGVATRQGVVTGSNAWSYDLVVHQALQFSLSANLGIGHYDSDGLDGSGYLYWNAGLSYGLGSVQLDLSYIATDARAKALFYDDVADNRWVGSLLWHF